MKRRSWTRDCVGRALLRAPICAGMVGLALYGCDNSADLPRGTEAKEETGDPTAYVHVDPALLASDRIATSEVSAFTHAGTTAIPGEVSPSPNGEAEVGALVGGRISSLEALEGAAVRKGDVLAWIDSPEIGAIRADWVRAGAQASAARKRLERQLSLQAQSATSQGAVDDARAAVQTAEADQQAARAKLSAVGVGAAGATGRIPVRAPIDGVVLERRATLGGAVAPDTLLFRIVNLQTLRIRAQWSETLGALPPVGTRVRLTPRQNLTSPTAAGCEGTVEVHSNSISRATRTSTLQVRPDPTCENLTPGAYLDVLVETASGDVGQGEWTQVPLQALVDLRGIPTVYVAGPAPGQFEARAVSPRPSVGGVVPIEAGLSPGERVVVKGVILLKGESLRDILGGD